MKINNKGFTLIELMITVAIVGILGAVALPAYQDYTIRSQVTEGLSLASGTKVAVAEYYANHGEFPADMAAIGMVSSQGSFIKSTALEAEGKITTTFGKGSNEKIHDGTVSLIPTQTNFGNLEWNCEATIEEKYLPTSCKQNGTYTPSDGSNGADTQEPDEPDQRQNYITPYERPDGSTVNADWTISLTPEQISKYGNFSTDPSVCGSKCSSLIFGGIHMKFSQAVDRYNDAAKEYSEFNFDAATPEEINIALVKLQLSIGAWHALQNNIPHLYGSIPPDFPLRPPYVEEMKKPDGTYYYEFTKNPDGKYSWKQKVVN